MSDYILPTPRRGSPFCACGCGNRTSSISTEYIRGHRPRIDPRRRFFGHVNKTAECWNWTASVYPNGYATFMPDTRDGASVMAHRYSYSLVHGEIPAEMTIDHLCKNRRCVNPEHLEVVTRGENSRRGKGWINSSAVRAQKAAEACPKGHPRTPEFARREADRWRCKVCRREQRSRNKDQVSES